MPCEWNTPAAVKEPKAVAEVDIKRHDPAKPIKRERLPLDDYDPRPLEKRSNTTMRFRKLCQTITEIEKQPGVLQSNISLLYGLPDPTSTIEQPEAPTLKDHVQARRSGILACLYDMVSSYTECSDKLSGVMATSQERQLEIAEQTTELSACPYWYTVRKKTCHSSFSSPPYSTL